MNQQNLNRFAIHYEKSNAIWQLSDFLLSHIPLSDPSLTFCCIGTDRSTGDSLGPLVGSYLQADIHFPFEIVGTLEKPLHALNLAQTVTKLETNKRYIVAIDACLADEASIGQIIAAHDAIYPGKAVQKKLPPVGNFSIKGVVNVGGFMEAAILQNTRLFVTQTMSTIVAKAILLAWQCYLLHVKHHSNNDTHDNDTWQQIGYTNFR